MDDIIEDLSQALEAAAPCATRSAPVMQPRLVAAGF
jgi:hypothetical protein